MAKSRSPKNTLRLTGPDSPPAENDFKALFAKHWQISKEFTLAEAEAMPAESYDFKPNPEEMSFTPWWSKETRRPVNVETSQLHHFTSNSRLAKSLVMTIRPVSQTRPKKFRLSQSSILLP